MYANAVKALCKTEKKHNFAPLQLNGGELSQKKQHRITKIAII
jgi:hypothetical protein